MKTDSFSAPKFQKVSAQQARDEYAAALVDMMNSLDEWKSAGAHVTAPVGAIQRFIHAICAQREIANGDYLATLPLPSAGEVSNG